MREILIGLVLLIASQAAFSEEILCKVRYEEDGPSRVFKPFDGGDLVIDVANGHAYLEAGDLKMTLVNSERVGTYGGERKHCAFDHSVTRDENGALQSFFISFGSCYLYGEDGRMKAVVSVSEFLDVKGNRGLYQETLYDGETGIQPYFRFNDCRVK